MIGRREFTVGGFAYSHHSARAASGDEDLAGVTLVLLESVSDHVGDRVAVAATVVGEGLLRRHIPAGARVGGLRVDDDEAVLLGQFGVRSRLEVRGASTLAVVDGNDDSGLGGKLVRDVDVHLGL
jgi:hypothetical protein